MKNFFIEKSKSIKTALEKIDLNGQGIICILNKSNKVLGIATDGDIRRKIINGISIDEPIEQCLNNNFTYVYNDEPRESLLKLLDNGIRAIPILDKDHNLLDVASRNNLPIDKNKINFARAKAPVRISFGGGGSDLTHFFSKYNGAVINATISIYSHAVLRKRNDGSIRIKSWDLNEEINEKNLTIALKKKSKLGLIQSLINLIKPEYGFDLEIYSDFPSNSGLGGSSAISAAVLGCFNEFREDPWDTYELSELAFQAERLNFNISGGWQDQYACTFGGFNFIEFTKETNIIHPLRVQKKTKLELEENIILCNTGISHNSGDIHENQKENMRNEDIENLVKENVNHVYKIKNQLLKNKLNDFGESLDISWQSKRQFSSKISSKKIDEIYNGAKKNGAIGGKLLGAGGGGFFIFYTNSQKRHELIKYLKEKKLDVFRFSFDEYGLQTWKSREEIN
jgi:D-glycero-alpha-D-manno-heptose-7-phosphate kinase